MTAAQKIIKYCAIAFACFLIVSIFSGIVGAASAVSSLFDGKHAVGAEKTYAVTDTVESLELELSGAQLEIRTGDNYSVASNRSYLQVECRDGLLLIKEDPSFGAYFGDVWIVLTVPEDTVFRRASVSTGAGTVKIDALCAETLALELGAGEVSIGKLAAGTRVKINGGAGELDIDSGELANLDLDLGVGEVNLKSRLTGACRLDYGVGELNLTLSGTADDYCISLDKGLGRATLSGTEMSDGAVYGDGENRIEIDGGVGDMEIEFCN